MLDGGFEYFFHFATPSRAVSTRMEANVIPPWNVAVSKSIRGKLEAIRSPCHKYIPTRLPNRMCRKAEASPLSIHELDSGVSKKLLPSKGRKNDRATKRSEDNPTET